METHHHRTKSFSALYVSINNRTWPTIRINSFRTNFSSPCCCSVCPCPSIRQDESVWHSVLWLSHTTRRDQTLPVAHSSYPSLSGFSFVVVSSTQLEEMFYGKGVRPYGFTDDDNCRVVVDNSRERGWVYLHSYNHWIRKNVGDCKRESIGEYV